MNYEDRTDLLAPADLVSTEVLSRLRLNTDAAERLMAEATAEGSVVVSPAAREAISNRVRRDTDAGSGAPAEAEAVEQDAMLCGYRFGRLALGPSSSSTISAEILCDGAERMYVYDLLLFDAPVPVRSILERHDVADQAAFEEAAGWAWAFGLGIAVIESDVTDAR